MPSSRLRSHKPLVKMDSEFVFDAITGGSACNVSEPIREFKENTDVYFEIEDRVKDG